MVRTILPDKLTAITAAQAIAAALFARERNGRGDHVRLAMIDAMVAWLWPDGMWNHTLIGEGVENKLPGGFNLVFKTADGYITAGALTDKEWAGLAHALGHPEWVADEQLKTIPDRVKNIEALLALIAAGLRALSSAQALKSLREEEVPCAPILNMEQVLCEPQLAANQMIEESDHPVAGPMRSPRPAARFDSAPPTDRRPAPALGEHTDEILAELTLPDGQ